MARKNNRRKKGQKSPEANPRRQNHCEQFPETPAGEILPLSNHLLSSDIPDTTEKMMIKETEKEYENIVESAVDSAPSNAAIGQGELTNETSQFSVSADEDKNGTQRGLDQSQTDLPSESLDKPLQSEDKTQMSDLIRESLPGRYESWRRAIVKAAKSLRLPRVHRANIDVGACPNVEETDPESPTLVASALRGPHVLASTPARLRADSPIAVDNNMWSPKASNTDRIGDDAAKWLSKSLRVGEKTKKEIQKRIMRWLTWETGSKDTEKSDVHEPSALRVNHWSNALYPLDHADEKIPVHVRVLEKFTQRTTTAINQIGEIMVREATEKGMVNLKAVHDEVALAFYLQELELRSLHASLSTRRECLTPNGFKMSGSTNSHEERYQNAVGKFKDACLQAD